MLNKKHTKQQNPKYKSPSGQKSLFFQPKLTINQPNDIYEQEADAVAKKVMRIPATETDRPFFHPKRLPVTHVQRKCAHCEEEEEKNNVQMKAGPATNGGVTAPPIIHDAVNAAGQSMDTATKNFMESRFGYDFSNVQIHNDGLAHRSSLEINALAYTHGHHVVFGAGQYQPQSAAGKQLLAHELAHVVQQSGKRNNPTIQRMKIGKGQPPVICKTGDKVQLEASRAGDISVLNAAFEEIKEIAYNKDKYSDCHQFFDEVCPGKNSSLKDTFDKVTVWKAPAEFDDESEAFVCSDEPNIMAYTLGGIEKGAGSLARTMLHELGHSCGIVSKGDHRLADKIRLYCFGPGSNKISVMGGKFGNLLIGSLAYQRFLTGWYAGQIRPSLGGDFTFVQETPQGAFRPFIAATAGLELRTDLWGGEGFGGPFVELEAGLGAGKFRDMSATELDKYNWSAGYVLQLKTGAEFAVPLLGTEGQVRPMSFEVAVKSIRPFNKQGEVINEITVGFAGYF